MSADAWRPCPFCTGFYLEQISSLEKELSDAYKTKIAIEYDIIKKKIEEKIYNIKKEMDVKSLLRVDGVHDFWFDEDGRFIVNIRASCPNCNRSWDLEASTAPKEKI